MILVENINYLRKHYPAIREEMKALEEAENKTFQMEETRKGDKTLSYMKDGKKTYFHSKYDPLKEAQILAEEYQSLEGKTIIFYGTGLGYHIDLIVKANPTSDFYIFEPIPELLEAFLSVQDLSKTDYKNLKRLSLGFENLKNEMSHFLDLNREDLIVIELPSHKKAFEEANKLFSDGMLALVKGKRHNLNANYAFQKRWTINSMKNLKEVLASPNILREKMGRFQDKPALIVAAGPSLNEEIENIRLIKDQGLAYIFSVGSAINTLIYHDIHPHAALTYDPTEFNQKVFQLVKEKETSDLPLIFGSSVGHETLEGYPGPTYHMITSQDNVSIFYLLDKDEEMEIVFDAPSIAVVTMQLLENLGFGPIILAGQNLAYLGKDRHSEGVSYSKEVTDQEQEKALLVEDVYGNMIGTDDGFNAMRQQMEAYISQMAPGRVLNTTKGGAKIKGAEFRKLKDIIEKDLKENIFDPDWLRTDQPSYRKEVIALRSQAMDQALEKLEEIIRDYNANLQIMAKLFWNRNFNQLEKMYHKLDVNIGDLESNAFFRVFLQQMNQVHHEMLIKEVQIAKADKNINEKHKRLLNNYQNFINLCVRDLRGLDPIYKEMKEDIEKFLEK